MEKTKRVKKKRLWVILLLIALALIAYKGFLDGSENENEGVELDTELEIND